jgi:methylthioribose-1-phosphate isomerase
MLSVGQKKKHTGVLVNIDFGSPAVGADRIAKNGDTANKV